MIKIGTKRLTLYRDDFKQYTTNPDDNHFDDLLKKLGVIEHDNEERNINELDITISSLEYEIED